MEDASLRLAAERIAVDPWLLLLSMSLRLKRFPESILFLLFLQSFLLGSRQCSSCFSLLLFHLCSSNCGLRFLAVASLRSLLSDISVARLFARAAAATGTALVMVASPFAEEAAASGTASGIGTSLV